MPLAQSSRASLPPCVTNSVHNATDTLDPSRGVSREATRVWPEPSTVRYAVVASRGVWRSLVACFVRDEEVVGSNPATPTAITPGKRDSLTELDSLTPRTGYALLSKGSEQLHRKWMYVNEEPEAFPRRLCTANTRALRGVWG